MLSSLFPNDDSKEDNVYNDSNVLNKHSFYNSESSHNSLNIHIIRSQGNLYWAKGMYAAMSLARKCSQGSRSQVDQEDRNSHYDFYLMVNDDVSFYDNAVSIMLNAYYNAQQEGIEHCGIVGATKGRDGHVSYGGKMIDDLTKSNAFIVPSGCCCSVDSIRSTNSQHHDFLDTSSKRNDNSSQCGYLSDSLQACDSLQSFCDSSHSSCSSLSSLQPCDLANWNCFLIDSYTLEKVGLIDNYYSHGYGDYDYSLMMKRAGIPIFVAPEVIGECDRNSRKGTFQDGKLSRKHRFNLFFSPKGLDWKSGMHFYIKNFDYLSFKGVLKFNLVYIFNIFKILFGISDIQE